ncbi:hypothetical protein J2W24_005496 [Variovorax boronicumulans]|uniref:hypothetical protein n=1 Tax=Variovorax boronicumulans TaxID=436515 RepID=UPI0027838450|nr:hypothetical protein [Variovorax boronicumulans]MDP9919816.1 hypothetical protein [Variovorax boronicumulans]
MSLSAALDALNNGTLTADQFADHPAVRKRSRETAHSLRTKLADVMPAAKRKTLGEALAAVSASRRPYTVIEMKIEDAIKRLQAAKSDADFETALEDFWQDEDVQLLKWAEIDYRRNVAGKGASASRKTVLAQLTSALSKERERIKAMSPTQAMYARRDHALSLKTQEEIK